MVKLRKIILWVIIKLIIIIILLVSVTDKIYVQIILSFKMKENAIEVTTFIKKKKILKLLIIFYTDKICMACLKYTVSSWLVKKYII